MSPSDRERRRLERHASTDDDARPHETAAAGEENQDGARTAARGSRRRSRHRGWFRELVITVGIALVLSLLLKTFLAQAFYIPSTSMENTLLVNDRVVVSKLTPRFGELHRGDVVVFEDPACWLCIDGQRPGKPASLGGYVLQGLSYIGLAPDQSDDHLIKRLIGLPGDKVAYSAKTGKLSVNGTVVDEPYVKPSEQKLATSFDVTVPSGDMWVMGDNRLDSADSAYHNALEKGSGFVPMDKITGKAKWIVWPFDRWSGLSGGEKAFTGVPAP